MLGKKPIGETKASRMAAANKAQADLENDDLAVQTEKKLKKNCIIIGVVSAVIIIAIGALLTQSYSKNRYLELQNKSIKAKMVELSNPKYDAVNDFILDQCEDEGVYCTSTQTNNPSLEMLKFLVNFREIPGHQYRLIFELSAGGEKKTKEVLKCDGALANFYVCQEITSSTPTDVIRAFEKSYQSLQGEATYDFKLMVKPIGQLEYAKPIGFKLIE